MVNINGITEKLNQTISELESLRSAFNSHIHGGVQTGGGISTVPLQPVTKSFSKYNKDDYEDKKCIH